MLLLQINNNLIESKLVKIYYLKNLLKKFKTQLKKLKTLKNVRLPTYNSNSFTVKSSKPISYIIGIAIYKTNVVIYISNIKGDVKFFYTAGALNLKKSQKKKRSLY